MAHITGVHSREVPQTWPLVKRFIQSGLMEGGDIEDLFARIMRRECALWVAKADDRIIAAAVTENVILDGRKICNVISCGGAGMDDWLGDLGMIEAWALSNECVAMRYEKCRPGWARVLAPKGYQTKFVVLEKAL